MAVGRGGRSLMGPLLVINLVVYLIVLGLAGWSLDKYIDGEQNHPHLGGNQSTSFMLMFALIGEVMSASSMLAGFAHLRKWNSHSLASAASSAIISWAITAIAFGLVCKQIIMGGHQGKRLQTLEGLITIAMVSQITLYTAVACWDLSQQVQPCLWFLWTSTLACSSHFRLPWSSSEILIPIVPKLFTPSVYKVKYVLLIWSLDGLLRMLLCKLDSKLVLYSKNSQYLREAWYFVCPITQGKYVLILSVFASMYWFKSTVRNSCT